MILGRLVMFPIPGRDPPPTPDSLTNQTSTTIEPIWNGTTPNPHYFEVQHEGLECCNFLTTL
jgi:hypothetical protein